MSEIHPTTVIEKGAKLADDVHIGPFCHIGPNVTLGSGTKIKSHVAIHGRTTIGKANTIWPSAVLGSDPQDLKYNGEDSQLVIGDNNDIRECATIHKGTAGDRSITTVGSNNLIMAYSHIGHDCIIDNHTIITNSVQLAGHIHIKDYAIIGGSSAVHHFVTIGKYAYIGGMTGITRDVPPFMFVKGNPPRVRGVNSIGLQRHGFDSTVQTHLKDAWRRLFKKSVEENAVLDSSQIIDSLEKDYPNDQAMQELITALRNSGIGVYGRYRETLRKSSRYQAPVR